MQSSEEAPQQSPQPRSPKEGEFVMELLPQDVLLGRGVGPNEHQGNVRFREIVNKQKPEYLATNKRKMKDKIAHKTIEKIKSSKGRFLKKLSNAEAESAGFTGRDVYVVADRKTVLEKTKQALRFLGRKNKANSSKNEGKPASVNSPGGSQIMPSEQENTESSDDGTCSQSGESLEINQSSVPISFAARPASPATAWEEVSNNTGSENILVAAAPASTPAKAAAKQPTPASVVADQIHNNTIIPFLSTRGASTMGHTFFLGGNEPSLRHQTHSLDTVLSTATSIRATRPTTELPSLSRASINSLVHPTELPMMPLSHTGANVSGLLPTPLTLGNQLYQSRGGNPNAALLFASQALGSSHASSISQIQQQIQPPLQPPNSLDIALLQAYQLRQVRDQRILAQNATTAFSGAATALRSGADTAIAAALRRQGMLRVGTDDEIANRANSNTTTSTAGGGTQPTDVFSQERNLHSNKNSSNQPEE